MKISVILAHPRAASFNHAIARTAAEALRAEGHEVRLHDLYQEGFPPELPTREFFKGAALPEAVAAHCREIAEAQGIVVVHPNWWGQPPAILKGWVDRVLRPGVGYEFLEGDNGEGIPRGLLRAEGAVVFNTSNTDPRREAEVFGDPLETIWRNCIFGYCGVERVFRKNFAVMITSTEPQRQRWLDEVKEDLRAFFLGQAGPSVP